MDLATDHLLTFLNTAEEPLIAALPGTGDEPLGERIARELVLARAKRKHGLTALDQLHAIGGLDDDGIERLRSYFVVEDRHPGFVRSNTRVRFGGGAVPVLAGFEKTVLFEAAEPVVLDEHLAPVDTGDEVTYDVYYADTLDRAVVFRAIEGAPHYKASVYDERFAIQTRSNRFLVAASTQLFATPALLSAGRFHVRHRIHNPHGLPFGGVVQGPNTALAVVLSQQNASVPKTLRFDEASNLVRAVDSATTPLAIQDFFDVEGTLAPPYWASPGSFKKFTLMNTKLPGSASLGAREYMAEHTPTGTTEVLRGTNDQVGWPADRQLRYVEIIQNVSIQSVHNPSHNGAPRVYVNAATTGAPSALYLAPGAPIPTSAKFDMFVFYGRWRDRRDIACRVAFRSRQNGGLLGLDASGEHLRTGGNSNLDASTTFYVEQGWGGGIDDIQLKTSFGKYVLVWGTGVGADSVQPINAEQFHIHIP